MENKDQVAFPQKITGRDGAFEYQIEHFGLSKLEYAVIHNMPEFTSTLKMKSHNEYDSGLSDFEKAQIDKTIEACRYALKAIEDMSNG